jgi:hypothetical protein
MESTRSDPELDDDFSEIYKEYTGPASAVTNNNIQDKDKPVKQRSEERCDEEEEQLPDPNSVPTDFTSREAKVWEAKSKATERNWKKRKEEEMICKICGESGHFTQGCPSTLGANRKSQEFFERVPARDNNVRVLFTEKVMESIERETSCKIKLDEKFIIVSGKDRLILRKGVDAVHKVKEDGEMKSSSVSHRSRSRSPRRTSVGPSRARNSEPQRQQLPSHGSSSFPERSGRQDKFVDNRFREETRVRENQRNVPRGSPQGRDRIGYLRDLVIFYFSLVFKEVDWSFSGFFWPKVSIPCLYFAAKGKSFCSSILYSSEVNKCLLNFCSIFSE